MANPLSGPRPDLTPADLLGGVLVAVPQVLALLGVSFSAAQTDALQNLVALGIALIGGDAVRRLGRNYAHGKSEAARVTAEAQVPEKSDAFDEEETVIEDSAVEDGVEDEQLPTDAMEEGSPPPENV